MATTAVHESQRMEGSRTKRIAYRFLLGLPALAAALFGGHLLISGWFSSLDGGSHRFHDLTWGVLEGVLILTGLLGSLWHAERRPAAYQQVVVGISALAATMVLSVAIDVPTIVIGALIIGAGFLHPARERLVQFGSWHGPSLVLGAAISAPLLWYALQQAALQRNGSMSDPHVEMAHYAGATAVALALAGVAILSAARQPGQHLVLACTTAGLCILGVASLLWPDVPSSFGRVGGAAALVAAAAIAVTGLAKTDGRNFG